MSTRLSIWSAEEDDILYRVMQYLKAQPCVGITFMACRQDFNDDELYLDLWTDADHAGDPADARSCSGWCLLLRGKRPRAALDAVAKKQSCTAKSSASTPTCLRTCLLYTSDAADE